MRLPLISMTTLVLLAGCASNQHAMQSTPSVTQDCHSLKAKSDNLRQGSIEQVTAFAYYQKHCRVN